MKIHRERHIPALLVAAPGSGSGKTSLALGLMAALRRRGYAVAPFKVGPDYIDPGHHALICGRPSHNLDGWMCGREQVHKIFKEGCVSADFALAEGVMGLFDGISGCSEQGSSAEIAKWLGLQVLLVVDARSQARSFAALVKGFTTFDPEVKIAGVIANRVGSKRHRQLLEEAIESTPGLPPLLGCLPRREQIELPQRHLGLVTAEDLQPETDFVGQLASWVEDHLDLDLLLQSAATSAVPVESDPQAKEPSPLRVRIGIARDRAFCFYYPENLQLLEQAGAELVPFSPLEDAGLPQGLDGLYLGGGYPELHAEQLSANHRLLDQVRNVAEAGMPIYAECGGFMLLCRAINGLPLAGVFPLDVRMLPKRRALGYRTVELLHDTLLGPAGTRARGHEFHYSDVDGGADLPFCYRLGRRDGEELGREGYRYRNVLGSYVHLHFASNPQLAENFVNCCVAQRG
ncbi:MAG: cobyrinate a,c-diamide synthase [Desulfuromonadales bacterium]|nr:cobyrinate a,c-diamide synthase [Desulfuromonadales bacterium]